MNEYDIAFERIARADGITVKMRAVSLTDSTDVLENAVRITTDRPGAEALAYDFLLEYVEEKRRKIKGG